MIWDIEDDLEIKYALFVFDVTDLGNKCFNVKRLSPMSAFNYFVVNTHSRGTCRRRGISWTGSTDTGSCSAGSQDTSRLASSGTRFASGCSVGRNPEDRSKILVVSAGFGVISEHTGGSEDIIWDGASERKQRNLHNKELPNIVSVQPNSLQLLFWRVCNRTAYNFYSGGTRIKI